MHTTIVAKVTQAHRCILKIGLLTGWIALFAWQCAPTVVVQESPTTDASENQDSVAIDQATQDNAVLDLAPVDTSPPPDRREPLITPEVTPDASLEPSTETTPDPAPQETPQEASKEAVPEAAPPEVAPPDMATTTCSEIKTFATGKSPTQSIYVASTGSDATGDGTVNKPYATLQRATKAATPGTSIVVRAGTYKSQSISGLQGTAQAPIWIGGPNGEPTPVFAGGSEGLHISKSRYLVFYNIEVTGSSSNGINCDDGGDTNDPAATTHIIFQNIKIHNIGTNGNQDCLKLSGLRDYFVLGSEFSKCGGGGSGSGIDHVGCHNGVIAQNTFKSMSGNAIQCKGGSTNIEILRNTMEDAGERAINMGGSTGFQFFRPPLSKTTPNAEARNILVAGNLIIGGNTPFAFVGCVDCAAIHNTIINPKQWLMRILQETNTKDGYTFEQSQRGRVANNIFYFQRQQISTYVNIGPNTQATTFSFQNNLWYAHDMASSSKPSLPATEQDGIYGKDPMFIRPTGQDYRLQASSPALGQGAPHNRPFADRLGQCFRVPPAIGAYEIAP